MTNSKGIKPPFEADNAFMFDVGTGYHLVVRIETPVS